MAIRLDTTIPRDVGGGQTGVQRAEGFARIRTEGIADMARKLVNLAQQMGASDDGQRFLDQSATEASKPLVGLYRENVSDVTGNLGRSATTKRGRKKYQGVGIAITGPSHKKAKPDEWKLETTPPAAEKAAGNHAWLVEFGTGRRKPGTQGRRTLLNLHDKVNGKMSKRSRVFNDEQFSRMSRSGGVFFIMGSKYTQGRSHGSGYPHDFIMALGPNQTYGAMDAQHPMEKAIKIGAPVVQRKLVDAVQKRISRLGGTA
jgi:hypothetical protein